MLRTFVWKSWMVALPCSWEKRCNSCSYSITVTFVFADSVYTSSFDTEPRGTDFFFSSTHRWTPFIVCPFVFVILPLANIYSVNIRRRRPTLFPDMTLFLTQHRPDVMQQQEKQEYITILFKKLKCRCGIWSPSIDTAPGWKKGQKNATHIQAFRRAQRRVTCHSRNVWGRYVWQLIPENPLVKVRAFSAVYVQSSCMQRKPFIFFPRMPASLWVLLSSPHSFVQG